MRFNKFDLNLLVVLDALLSEMSITKAGEKVFLSQSATSGALSRLRDYFDDPILTPMGRKMVLTPLGESLVMPVKESLMHIQRTLESAPNIEVEQYNRKISIIVSDVASEIIFSKVAAKVSKIAPNVSFEAIPISNDPLQELEQGKVDFILLPDRFISENHPSAELFSESFVVICWDQHATLKDSISIDEYKKLGHVMTKFGPQGISGLDHWITTHSGIQRRSEIIVSAFSVIPSFIVGTQRIATVHKRMAEVWASYLPIKILNEPLNISDFTWCLQWHSIKSSDLILNWFKDLMLETAQELNHDSELK